MRVGVVIAAAGSGRRMAALGTEENKVFLPLDGKPVIAHSLECFATMEEVAEIVVVTQAMDQDRMMELAKRILPEKAVQVVIGGKERQESVYRGLQTLNSSTEWVIIHDGARPYITLDLVRSALEAAKKYSAVGVGVPVKDTIKRVQGGFVQETLVRSELWAMQTPQVFSYDLILGAHAEAVEKGLLATDDCALLESLDHPVHIVQGDYRNIKITTPEDLPQKEIFMVGFGYDVHRLVEGRPLILGGVEIPYERGLLGHSDADVVTHTIMDALLGAMGQGDIGELFPDTDPKYKGISSILLLEHVLIILEKEKVRVNNLDITIIAQKPKLAPWKAPIKAKLAQVMGIRESQINIKATTTEGLGFVGREEGIATQVVVSLCK